MAAPHLSFGAWLGWAWAVLWEGQGRPPSRGASCALPSAAVRPAWPCLTGGARAAAILEEAAAAPTSLAPPPRVMCG